MVGLLTHLRLILLPKETSNAEGLAMLLRKFVPTTAVFFLVTSLPAHAYLDPGTGSIIVQSLIGGIAAASTLAGIYLEQVKSFVRRILGKGGPEERGGAQ